MYFSREPLVAMLATAWSQRNDVDSETMSSGCAVRAVLVVLIQQYMYVEWLHAMTNL